jgi:hypothetical protein
MTGLSDAQARRVLSTFGYVDELLRSVEHLANPDRSPFERPVPDLAPEEARLLLTRTEQLRRRMLEALHELGLEPPPHRGSARWSIQTALRFASIELDKLDAAGLRGYGSVNPETGDLLGALTARLATLARSAAAAVADRDARDLEGRAPEPDRGDPGAVS